MRKLAIVCFSFSIAVFISNYILPHALLPVAAILFLAGAVYFIIRPAKFLRPVIISFISLSVGFGLFFVNAHSTSLKAEKYVGLITELEARLITYPKVYDDYCRAEIKLSSPSIPAFKAVLYDNSMGIADAKPGDIINFSGKLSSAGTRYGKAYDHYYSKDIYFIINSRSDVEVLTRFDVRALPQIVNRYMTEHIEGIFPQDTAAFIKSLLLGDKTDLYEMPEQYNDLSRAGLSHIVAVSG
ncbi:MAG: hypothetical protein IJ364_01030, partial [Oscillospiraceae bacterium]|nr:hypothetical protein [Oscillospiraceae bacterium]